MLQRSSAVRSIAEIDLHERLTLVGFTLSYFALMAVVVSSTMPFLLNNWSSVWPMTLGAALCAALLIVGGLFVPPKGYRHGCRAMSTAPVAQPRLQIDRVTVSAQACLLLASAFLFSSSAAAETPAPRVREGKNVFSAQQSKDIGDAVRRSDEARQIVWDRKLRAITKDVCVGC